MMFCRRWRLISVSVWHRRRTKWSSGPSWQNKQRVKQRGCEQHNRLVQSQWLQWERHRGPLVYFEGQRITGSCRELSAGPPVSPAVGADGGLRQEERAEEQRGRRPEWRRHHATSAGPTAGPPAGSPAGCLTAFSWVLTRSWKQGGWGGLTEADWTWWEEGLHGESLWELGDGRGVKCVLCRKESSRKSA